MKLYIAKINNIRVLQGNDSTLSSENKSSSRGDIKKGKNKTNDLGEGKKEIATTILVQDGDTMDKIFKVLSKERKCKITDKFLGVISVSVLNYTIINSDKHIGLTRINLKLAVEEDFNIKIDYKGQILKHIHKIKKSLKPQYLLTNSNNYQKTISNNILDMDDVIKDDYITKFKSFDRMQRNINESYDIPATVVLNDSAILDNGMSHIENLSYEHNSIYSIPLQVKGYTPNLLDSFSTKGALLNNINANSVLFNKLYIIDNLHRLIDSKNSDINPLTHNLITLVTNTILCLDNSLTDDRRITFEHILSSIINFRDSMDDSIIIVRLHLELLSRYIYKRYGNLDNMEQILRLNNLREDTIINDYIKIIN